jgi:hypothetical protein
MSASVFEVAFVGDLHQIAEVPLAVKAEFRSWRKADHDWAALLSPKRYLGVQSR